MFTPRVALLLLCLVLLAVPGAKADKVDRYVQAQLSKYNVPGLSLAVVKDGKVIKTKGYGLANVELNVPATPQTVYQWASVTKQFTASAIMLLIEEKKLSLEAPIQRYLPDLPASWSNVTVKHLLNHTSGIKSYTGIPNFFKDIRKDFSQDELIGLVREQPLEFEPGARWAYNNTGYFLLGMIIEKVSGRAYGDFLAERLFQPAGMTTARINEQLVIITNRATGYASISNRWRISEFVSPTQPFSAGALAGTVYDLARWDAALYGDKPLPASIRNLMWTPTRLNDGKTSDYGFGWELGDIRGHRFVSHGGGIHGFSTYILRLLEDKLTVVVLMNGDGGAASIARGVADHYIPGLSLATIKPRTDPDPAQTGRLLQCLRDLAATKDSKIVTAAFREDYQRARGRAQSLADRLKDLRSFRFVIVDLAAAGRERFGAKVQRIAHYQLVTAKETRFYSFELTPDNAVAYYQSSEQ